MKELLLKIKWGQQWLCNRSLSEKLTLLISLLMAILILITLNVLISRYEKKIYDDMMKEAVFLSDGALNGLNVLMQSGDIGRLELRSLMIKKMGQSEFVVDFRVVRGEPVRNQFGYGSAAEQPIDDMDREVLQSGVKKTELMGGMLRVVVPFLAKKEFRGSACTSCHSVSEGTVLGAASVTMDASDEIAKIQVLKWTLMVGALLSLVVIYFVIKKLVARFLSPLNEIEFHLKKLSQGDFVESIAVSRQDEIGRMEKCLADVQHNLGGLLGTIRNESIQLTQMANRVAMVSNMTSQGIKSQKDETTLASETVQQIARSLEVSVHASNNAVDAANAIAMQADTAKQVVTRAIDSIHLLADEVRDATELMQSLERESNEIRSVTQLIADIAEQTNLLALNAAIEAARAGEQGRGFAVVAGEVRKLAYRTQDATHEIRNKIESLQLKANNATLVMTQGRVQADDSVSQINNTNASLDQIIRTIEIIRATNLKIAESVKEESEIATNINQTIINISNVGEQTAFSSRSTASEIGMVAEHVRKLDLLISKFKYSEIIESNQTENNAVDDVLF